MLTQGRESRDERGGQGLRREREAIVFGLGAWELLLVLGIVVVLFGARRLPEIGSGVGKAIANFKSGVSGKDEIDVTPTPAPDKDEVSDGKPPS